MTEEINYEKLLAVWLEEREALDRMISWAKRKIGRENGDTQALQIATFAPALSEPFKPILGPDTFFRMSVSQAVVKYLNMMKRPQSVTAITQALQAGGLTSKAKNLYSTVFPTLQRMAQADEVVKVTNGEWGLSEWYGSGRGKTSDKSEDKEG